MATALQATAAKSEKLADTAAIAQDNSKSTSSRVTRSTADTIAPATVDNATLDRARGIFSQVAKLLNPSLALEVKDELLMEVLKLYDQEKTAITQTLTSLEGEAAQIEEKVFQKVAEALSKKFTTVSDVVASQPGFGKRVYDVVVNLAMFIPNAVAGLFSHAEAQGAPANAAPVSKEVSAQVIDAKKKDVEITQDFIQDLIDALSAEQKASYLELVAENIPVKSQGRYREAMETEAFATQVLRKFVETFNKATQMSLRSDKSPEGRAAETTAAFMKKQLGRPIKQEPISA
jgi:hypothetical protein